jgi:FtsH-binding integral membrane protein
MAGVTSNSQPSTLAALRWLVLALLTFGMLGTAVDLVLLAHNEDVWQWPPLALIVAGLMVVAWIAVRENRAAILTLRWTMSSFVVAGIAGLVLHYNGNREFQKELDPALSGWPLFVKVVTAKAPPAVAPAGMIQLGLLGLLFTYKNSGRRQA